MDIRDLKVFAAVASSHSFAGAARALRMSTSAISRSVASLETEIGAQLLRRTTRSVALTEAGRLYLNRASSILDALEQAEKEVQGIKDTPAGKIMLSVPPGFVEDMLARTLPRFLSDYPDITLDIDVSARRVDLIEDGYDVVLRAGEIADSTLLSTVVSRARFCPVASPEFLKSHDMPSHPRDLETLPCLTWVSDGTANVWRFTKNQVPETVTVSGPLSARSAAILIEATRSGAGIALLPEASVHDDLAKERLVRVLPDFEPDPLIITVLWTADRLMPVRLRAFLDALKNL